jgi:hypothetical protein
MRTKVFRSMMLMLLAAGGGCTTVQAAGPYIRDITLDPDGRVSSFERCMLVVHYSGDVFSVEGQECQQVKPTKNPPPAPAAPVRVDAPR